MKKANTELKLTIFNTPYERDVPSMSKAQCLKNGENENIARSKIFPFALYRGCL